MNVPDCNADVTYGADRREFDRLAVQCRARIVIGTRHYIGYLHDISPAGARLRTVTPIRKPGTVLLRLPDLPLLRCELRWSNSCNAGVAFTGMLSQPDLKRWLCSRLSSAGAEAARSRGARGLGE